MATTILKLLKHAHRSIQLCKENEWPEFGTLSYGQLTTAVALLEKGYALDTEVKNLLDQHGGKVEDVPDFTNLRELADDQSPGAGQWPFGILWPECDYGKQARIIVADGSHDFELGTVVTLAPIPNQVALLIGARGKSGTFGVACFQELERHDYELIDEPVQLVKDPQTPVNVKLRIERMYGPGTVKHLMQAFNLAWECINMETHRYFHPSFEAKYARMFPTVASGVCRSFFNHVVGSFGLSTLNRDFGAFLVYLYENDLEILNRFISQSNDPV